jgi:hypothetical protein
MLARKRWKKTCSRSDKEEQFLYLRFIREVLSTTVENEITHFV